MGFQFNFFNSNDINAEKDKDNFYKRRNNSENFLSSPDECFEWKIPEEIVMNPKARIFESEMVHDSNFPGLLKRTYCDVVAELKNKNISNDDSKIITYNNRNLASITETSDIVPKLYEGGLKTWECSLDLLQVLKDQSSMIKGLKVLEIGCGSGLPGIFCFKHCAADSIIFQDYNQSVLESVTLPNLLLNSNEITFSLDTQKLKLFYGDWKNFSSKLDPKSIDLILTSETIYRCESYPWLLDIFSHCLNDSKDAKVLVAAKDYYFGLGGSVREFSKFAISCGWTVICLRQFDSFEGVPRSVLQLSRSEA